MTDAEYHSMMEKLCRLKESIIMAQSIPRDQFRDCAASECLPEHWIAIGDFFVVPRSAVKIPDEIDDPPPRYPCDDNPG